MPRAAPPSQPHLFWREIGRSWPDQEAEWTTWVAHLNERGDALYRCLIAANGEMTVTVDLRTQDGLGGSTLHRGRCPAPPAPAEAAERRRVLLARADAAVVAAVEAARSRSRWTHAAAGRADPLAGPEFEHRIRYRAYFLWEQEGRPEGRAEEFWERARQEEARCLTLRAGG
jgi:hypothetical protein